MELPGGQLVIIRTLLLFCFTYTSIFPVRYEHFVQMDVRKMLDRATQS